MAPQKGNKFVYQKRSKEDLMERANRRGGDYDDIIKANIKKYKPREGKNMIRILPPTWEGAKHYGYDIWVNYNIGADKQSYLSLKKMKNTDDPLNEARDEAEQSGDRVLAKALKPSNRIAMWVIDRMSEEEGPQFWAAPFTFDKDLANLSFDEDTHEVIFIDDVTEGCDVRFYKEGTGIGTKYLPSKMRLMKPSNIHEDEGIEQDWLNYIKDNPIPDCLNFYDYDYIAKAFNGVAGRGDDDDEDENPRRKPMREDADEKPSHRSRNEQPTAKTRRAEPEDEDDEIEEKPTRQRSRVSREDEEEPETRPARRKVAVAASEEEPKRRTARNADPEPEDEDEEVEETTSALSIRERLSQRRGASSPSKRGSTSEPPFEED